MRTFERGMKQLIEATARDRKTYEVNVGLNTGNDAGHVEVAHTIADQGVSRELEDAVKDLVAEHDETLKARGVRVHVNALQDPADTEGAAGPLRRVYVSIDHHGNRFDESGRQIRPSGKWNAHAFLIQLHKIAHQNLWNG